jgi:protein SCO1/2
MRPLYAGALTAAAIVGVAIGVGLHSTLGGNAAARPPSLPDLHGQATWRPNARPAPPVALRDQHRRLVSLRSLRGSTVVLTFMDSLCKQACPIEGRMLASAIRQVSPRDRPQLVVVSVDPAGDSADSVARAARKWTLPHDVIWLLGTQRQLARIWRAYDITVEPVSGDIVHSTALYLIDKRGDERAGFLLPFVPGLVADDLRRLGAEPA